MCCGWGERESIWNSDESSTGSLKTRKMLTNRGRGRNSDFRFTALYGFLLCLCLMIYSTSAAPAKAAAPNRKFSAAVKNVNTRFGTSHLSRLKRDAEVSFGNSQNEPRDKKSAAITNSDTAAAAASIPAVVAANPAASVVNPETAAVEVKPAQPAAGDSQAAGDTLSKPEIGKNVAEAPPSAEKPAAEVSEPSSLTAAAKPAAEASTDKKKDEDKALDNDEEPKLEHPSESSEKFASSENLSQKNLENEEDNRDVIETQGQGKAEENESAAESRDDDVITGNSENSDQIIDEEMSSSSKESDDNFASDTNSIIDESSDKDDKKSENDHSSSSRLKKRSAPSMVAESMGRDIGRPQRHRRSSSRTKRDLGYDELREILSGGQSYPGYGGDEDYPLQLYPIPEEEDYEPDYEQADSRYDDGGWLDQPENSLGDGAFLVPTKREEAVQKEIVRYEVLQRLLKEKEQEQAKEAVLEYLIAAAEDRLKDAIEEEREAEIDERLEKLGFHPDALMEKENSRSYKVDKRFPYSYEPYGGPWGAVVPGVKRSSRNWYKPVEEDGGYGRLYRLAEALGDN